MRVVLSRKGFDSTAGGGPSPVLEDDTMLSLPIPETGGEGHTPKNLAEANWHRYDDLILRPEIKRYCENPRKREQKKHKHCHLDPDIRPELWKKLPEGWYPAFGQCDASAKHLKNNLNLADILTDNVLFLFFGLFRRLQENGKFTGAPFHAIWGYMLCDKVEEQTAQIPQWHPHAAENLTDNLLFIAKDKCYGTFKHCPKLELTVHNQSPSRWKLDCLPWLDAENRLSNMTYHDDPKRFNLERGYFQSTSPGQEFVVTSQAADVQNLKWENCSFCQILSNLKKMYQKE